MIAGRELDALIAEKVMGLHVVRVGAVGIPAGIAKPRDDVSDKIRWVSGENDSLKLESDLEPIPHYSTDLEEAEKVNAEMRKRGFTYDSVREMSAHDICLAALKAVGVQV